MNYLRYQIVLYYIKVLLVHLIFMFDKIDYPIDSDNPLKVQNTNLDLYINGIPLASLRFSSIMQDRIDFKFLFNELVKQVNNMIEYGLYGDGKLIDAINNNKFNGFDKIYP